MSERTKTPPYRSFLFGALVGGLAAFIFSGSVLAPIIAAWNGEVDTLLVYQQGLLIVTVPVGAMIGAMLAAIADYVHNAPPRPHPMLNYRESVLNHLASIPPTFPDDEWVVIDRLTIERDWGWVYFWDSRLHQETGDKKYRVAGNAPFIVRRVDGMTLGTGTDRPVEEWIEDYFNSGQLPQLTSS
jgi:hypothetical protein